MYVNLNFTHPLCCCRSCLTANVSQLRNVRHFKAITCPPVTKVATKSEPCVKHCPPHVFLGAIGKSTYFDLSTQFSSFIPKILPNSFLFSVTMIKSFSIAVAILSKCKKV